MSSLAAPGPQHFTVSGTVVETAVGPRLRFTLHVEGYETVDHVEGSYPARCERSARPAQDAEIGWSEEQVAGVIAGLTRGLVLMRRLREKERHQWNPPAGASSTTA